MYGFITNYFLFLKLNSRQEKYQKSLKRHCKMTRDRKLGDLAVIPKTIKAAHMQPKLVNFRIDSAAQAGSIFGNQAR